MLSISTNLPESCPEIGTSNLQYRDILMDVTASKDKIEINVKSPLETGLSIRLEGQWRLAGSEKTGSLFVLTKSGEHTFRKE